MPGRRASVALGGAVPELSAEHGACHLSGRRAGLGAAGPDKPDEAGHHTAVWLWFPFYFVYLRQRDQSQGKPWRLLQVWVLCTALSFVALYQFSKQSGTENLAQSACGLVTKILRDEGYDERCIRVTDMQEEVSGRFWRAQALLNTGVKEPVTIERRGREIYVMLPEAGE